MATKKTTTINFDATIYSVKGAKSGSMTLPEKVFGLSWNGDLVHEVVTAMLANKRAGTAHTKDRSDVSGGGKKPWKQKGTGRARHGSTRSPIWVGGGTTHGPRNEKDYEKKINKKARVKALFTVLSRQYTKGSLLLVDDLGLSAIKTKDAADIFSKLSTIDSFEKIGGAKKRSATLVVVPELTSVVQKSFANLQGATVVAAPELNALMVANAHHVVLVNPETVVPTIESKMK